MAINKHIAELIVRYRRNTLNEQEKKELEAWCNLCEENQLLFNQLNEEYLTGRTRDELYSKPITEEGGKIMQMYPHEEKRRFNTVIKYTVIVTGLLLTVMTVYSIINRHPGKKKVENNNQATEKVGPNRSRDTHRVQLKLADGRIVYLDSSVNGHIAFQYRSVIYKQGDLLRYEWSNGNAQPELEYNTITTPRARKFTLELPDGSRAWLNASSSITYPTAFISKERIVHITGEVYFEVNPAPVSLGTGGGKSPFIVYVNPLPGGKGTGAVVEVTGTHFNVNAYGDEPVIKTTLLQGKVKVGNQFQPSNAPDVHNETQLPAVDRQRKVQWALLTPGQQAQINGEGQLGIIKYADIQEIMAWHRDLIIFNDLDIKQIMQQLARQYDYDVVFEDGVNGHYTLSVTRQTTIDQVLETLELSGGVHFDIADHKIIVSQ